MYYKLILVLIVITNFACSKNIFDEIANKDSQEAIYFQAKSEINKRNYSDAIDLFARLDADYLDNHERKAVYASAYSGRCGLEFLTLLSNLQNSSGSTVIALLMGAFPNSTLLENAADCNQSQSILATIGDQTVRNGNENLLMAFTSFSEIGTTLSAIADLDADGVADATFDQCDITDFPEQQVREIGSSIALALISLAAIGTSYVDGATADVTALCNLDPNLSRFCTNTDPSAFTANEVQALRYAIGSNDFGIDSCGGNDFANCAIANPSCP
jgi:hypothetical protein